MHKNLLVALAFAVVALSGCADDPPAGEFSKQGHALVFGGGVQSATYTAYDNPAEQQSNGLITNCWPEGQPDPLGYTCTPASSVVTFHFMTLPAAGGQTYSIDLYDSAGAARTDVGNLPDADENGMVNYDWNDDEDVSATYDSYQLFLGDHLVASGGLTGDMDLNPALTQGSFDAMYKGKDLTVTTSGMSADFTFEGWLVNVDPETGAKTHAESFSLAGDGETTYKATMNVASFQEFHIHVTGTQLNVGVASIA